MENGTAAMSHSILDALSVVSFEGSNELSVQQFFDSIQSTVTIDQPVIPATSETNCSISVPESNFSLDEDDLFQCGRCKNQFSSLSKFINHKRIDCIGKCSSPTYSSEKEEVSHVVDISQPLDQSTAPINHQRGEDETSHTPVNSYACGITTEETDHPSINVGEFLNLAISGTQVFTLNGNLQISQGEGKNFINLNAPAALLPAATLDIDSEVVASSSLAAKDFDNGSIFVQTANGTSEESCPKSQNETLNESDSSKSQLSKLKVKQQCQFCEKEFAKKFDLEQHIRSHTGEKPFQCVVCGRPFAQKSNVKKHMATHKVWPKESIHSTLPENPIKRVVTSDVEEEIYVDDSYVCPFCNISVDNYLKLRTHMKIHRDKKVYRCIQKKCDATFLEMDPFLEHIHEHVTDVQYKCHHCSKAFSSLNALAFHQLEHSIYPRNKKKLGPVYFRCTKCMNKYASSEALEHHRKTSSHHFPCQQCSRVFCSERLLRRHLRVHGTMPTSTCPTCSKEFKSEYSLKLHLLTHTDERPFSCYLCNAAFNRKDKLKRHMLIHEEKKFKCPYSSLGCKHEFRRGDKLRLHILTHAFHPSKGSSLKSKNVTTNIPIDGEESNPNSKRIKHFANIIRGGKHNSKKSDSPKHEVDAKFEPEISTPKRNPFSQSAIVTRIKSGTRPRNDYSKFAEASVKKSPKNKGKRVISLNQSQIGNFVQGSLFDNIDTNEFLDSTNQSMSSNNEILLASPSNNIAEAESAIQSAEDSLTIDKSIIILKPESRSKDSLLASKSLDSSVSPNNNMINYTKDSSVQTIYIPFGLPEEEMLTSNIVKSECDVGDSSITLEIDSTSFAAIGC